MMFQASIYFAIILIGIQGKELDPGPQTFSSNNSSSSTPAQTLHKRFATKEVVVYLTPTQIKALESGKAELRSQSPDEITINQLPNSQKLSYQSPQVSYQRHIENLNILKAPLIPEPRLQNKQSIKQEGKLIENSQEKQNIEELSKFRFLQQEKPTSGFKNKQNSQEGANEEWRSFIPITEKNQEAPSLQEQLNEHWQEILEKNREQLKLISNYQPESLQNPSPQLQYAPNFYVQRHEFQLENALREQNINELENQRAIAQAAAIANLPPVIIHKEVQITKHRAVPIVKHVNVPVPTPVLVPILEPYAVKVPHPYPVPVEVIRHIPVAVKAEPSGAEKSPVAPNQGQKHIPVRNVYINVDSPSLYAWRN